MALKRKVCYCFTFTIQELEKLGLAQEYDMDNDDSSDMNKMMYKGIALNERDLLLYVQKQLKSKENVYWNAEDMALSCDFIENNGMPLLSILVVNRYVENYSEHYDIIERESNFDKLQKKNDIKFKAGDFELDERRYKFLAQYSTNMCVEQLEGDNLPKVGFDKYIDQICQSLSRYTKNSPLIVGDKGVGKTALMNHFAYCMANGKVPKWLSGYSVLNLDLQRMISGSRYRGDFEERLLGCLDEAVRHGKVILVIDDVHTAVGAGATNGEVNDASSMLLPFITSGKLKVVATTNFEQYAHVMEQRNSFGKAFHVINMEEPKDETLVQIMHSVSKQMGTWHSLRINDDINDIAVKLARRYKSDKKLPDSAIDLIDEACAKQRCKSRLKTLDKAYVYQVVSEQLGVSLEKISVEDTDKLVNLESRLSKRVLGQEEAIKALAKSIRSSRVGMQDETKPLGSFIFAGSTGVGKTELCKTLAEELFGDDTAFVRIDMSEYMEGHSVSKLIGSPKGYVGYGEGGVLTDAVAKKPYTIVLFDEIEKAHPQVMNILLQVLDDGRLTDSTGKTVDFKNTVIIMTTNAGAKKKGEDTHLGFVAASETSRKKEFLDAIKQCFKPEFLNRIDDIIVFNKLDTTVIRQIVNKLLNDVSRRAKEQGYTITFDESVIDYCMKNGYDEENGVRPMQHFIQKEIVAYISNMIITGGFEKEKFILAYDEDTKLTVRYIEDKVLALV